MSGRNKYGRYKVAFGCVGIQFIQKKGGAEYEI
jgi:hypothetical protein